MGFTVALVLLMVTGLRSRGLWPFEACGERASERGREREREKEINKKYMYIYIHTYRVRERESETERGRVCRV